MRRCSVLLLAVWAAFAQDRIGRIEFYGTEGVDLAKVRRALRVKPGQKVFDKLPDLVDEAVQRALGQGPVDTRLVCCDAAGKSTLYIGLPGRNVAEITTYAAPVEELLMPPALRSVLSELETAVSDAVQRGPAAAIEDDSSGYALLQDSATRALQLKLRELALREEKEIFDVLQRAGSVAERTMAAVALGYSRQSPEQVRALTRACSDPAESVRNAAARALLVLLRSGSALMKNAEPDVFVDMLRSPIWSDRNKAGNILELLTAGREPKLLQLLREHSVSPLLEMAAWGEEEHAQCYRILLGRMASLQEADVRRLSAMPGGQELIHRVITSPGWDGK